MRARFILIAALALSGCATVPQASSTAEVDNCRPSAASLESRAGREWLHANGWRHTDRASAETAYGARVRDKSPWPDWYRPADAVLPPGTRVQMALAPGQSPESPGGYITSDRIDSVREVRHALAVRRDWKARVDRVETFEVTRDLPVKLGPIGPQVDPVACRLLPGRWSQAEMQIPREQRMTYLKVIEVRTIR